MEYCLAVYSSVTVVNRIKKHLRCTAGYLNVIHTPKSISKGGCSYSLKFKKQHMLKVKKASEELNIKIKGIYIESVENNNKIYNEIE